MLVRSGIAQTAELLDFGLAKPLAGATRGAASDATLTNPLTSAGEILGTLPYMAPEQLERREDARTDIFAFGLVVQEMATGVRVFQGATQAALIADVMHTDPPALERLVRACLAKDPEERWQSAQDLVTQLNGLSEPASAPSGALAAPVAAKASAPRSWIGLAAGFVAAAVALTVWGLAKPAPPPPRAAS